MKHGRTSTVSRAFTIVELLIVIVVIGILATIALIAYNGIQDRAKIAVISSDLENAKKSLASSQIYDPSGNYPADLSTAGLKASANVSFQYSVNNAVDPKTYCVTAQNGKNSYYISNTAAIPSSGACAGHTLPGAVTCATGYVVVPGNATFGTTDFCVMKYEPRNVSGVATSSAAGLPWVSISQVNAISTATAACSGCHLITENEWMTIANNVLGVGSNWSGGSPGSGAIYRGHTDAAPNNLIAADTVDTNGYVNTGDSSGNQRRTLTLSNGEVIWDFAGNAYEWINLTLSSGQFPGLAADSSNTWKEYDNSSLIWRGLPTTSRTGNVYPGSSTWTSAYGIGSIASNYNETVTRAAFRGGSFASVENGGVLSISLGSAPTATSTSISFRVVRAPN